MASDSLSRRRLLRTGLVGTTTISLAGCSGLLKELRFAERWEMDLHRPLVEGGPTPWNGPPLYATLVQSSAEARRAFNQRALDEYGSDEWLTLDYSNSFVAVLVSRLQLTKPGTSKGWCPRTKIDGDSFVFDLTFESWPNDYRLGEVFATVEHWQLRGNDPPKRATVDVTLAPGAKKSCRD